jgi:uncharacterized cupredoxin-like copper-binding protein
VKRSSTLLALSAVGLAAATPAAVTAGGPAPTGHAAATTVGVTATEFKFAVRPSSARAGRVTFRLRNAGKVKHDLKIAGRKTPVINPKKTTSLSVNLRPGTYAYLCTVPGHADAGMRGRFRVR